MSTDFEKAAEANRLYWETETSVGDIAQKLDLSRRALYDALQPTPTGALCGVCGGDMAFENRSARTANQPVCTVCGARPENEPESVAEPEAVAARSIDPRTLRLGGAMVFGAIAGAIATLIAVPRR
jgi:hypothetical protein